MLCPASSVQLGDRRTYHTQVYVEADQNHRQSPDALRALRSPDVPISQHFVELLLVSTEAQPLKARCRGVKVLTLKTSPCPKHWIDA